MNLQEALALMAHIDTEIEPDVWHTIVVTWNGEDFYVSVVDAGVFDFAESWEFNTQQDADDWLADKRRLGKEEVAR